MSNKTWTQREQNILTTMRAEGHTFGTIAARLNRTTKSVRRKHESIRPGHRVRVEANLGASHWTIDELYTVVYNHIILGQTAEHSARVVGRTIDATTTKIKFLRNTGRMNEMLNTLSN